MNRLQVCYYIDETISIYISFLLAFIQDDSYYLNKYYIDRDILYKRQKKN